MALSLNNFPTFSVAALYVGDLHPDVNETMLFEKFSSVGQVVSMHLCRDMVTRRSLGYAYINFQSIVDAERALDTMNFDLLKGRPIRIMWSQRDPSLRRSGVGNVFIKNLEKTIDNKALYDTFAAFGGILSCKIAYDEDGRSKGYGFVHFETTEAAEKAIQKVDGMLLRGKKVYVGKFIPRIEREKQMGERQKLFTNVFVKNFGDELDDEKLREMFASFGTITSSKVMRDDEGASKGFGFVAYENPEAAAAAVRELNSKELPNGMVLYVGRAQKKAERQMELRRRYEQLKSERYSASLCTNLFVKNLDDTIDDNRLREEFEKYGTVTSVKVMEENGRSKGFGFVSYSTVEDATRGLREMNGRMVGSKPLYVGLAQRKEDRKAYLAAQRVSQVMHVRTGNYAPCNLFSPCLIHHQRMLHATPRWNIPPQIRATASPLARVAPMAGTVGAVPPARCTRPRTVTVPTTVPRAVVSATRTMVQGANTTATAPNRTPSLTGYALRSVRSSSSIPQNSIEHKDSNPNQPVVMQVSAADAHVRLVSVVFVPRSSPDEIPYKRRRNVGSEEAYDAVPARKPS